MWDGDARAKPSGVHLFPQQQRLQKFLAVSDMPVLKRHICQLLENGVHTIPLDVQVNALRGKGWHGEAPLKCVKLNSSDERRRR